MLKFYCIHKLGTVSRVPQLSYLLEDSGLFRFCKLQLFELFSSDFFCMNT